MAELKTKPTGVSVAEFVASVPSAERRADAEVLIEIMQTITKQPAIMWGPSIIGFGEYHYRYASGREADFLRVGFSPRKASLVLYILPSVEAYPELLADLGPHTTGKSCLYLKRLSEVHLPTLKKLIRAGLRDLAAQIKEQSVKASAKRPKPAK